MLAELGENKIKVDYDKLNFENLFRDFICRKIQRLEEDVEYKGLGKALFVSAVLCSDENLHYFTISENALLGISEHLGNNEEIKGRIKFNEQYPELFNSLAHIEELKFKSGVQLNRLRFNHDLIAEKGISLIQETKYQSEFFFDIFEAKKLIQVCLDMGEYNAGLTFFMWLNYRKNISVDKFFDVVFNGKISEMSLSGLTRYRLSLNRGEQKYFAERILNQEDFFKLPPAIVSHSLRIWRAEGLGKEKAKEILNQENFFELPSGIVSLSLDIWKDKNFGKVKAREILKQKCLFKLSKEIVLPSLRICQDEKLGKEKARGWCKIASD